MDDWISGHAVYCVMAYHESRFIDQTNRVEQSVLLSLDLNGVLVPMPLLSARKWTLTGTSGSVSPSPTLSSSPSRPLAPAAAAPSRSPMVSPFRFRSRHPSLSSLRPCFPSLMQAHDHRSPPHNASPRYVIIVQTFPYFNGRACGRTQTDNRIQQAIAPPDCPRFAPNTLVCTS